MSLDHCVMIKWKQGLTLKIRSGYQVVATGQINFFPKTQVVVPVYDRMASIVPHS